MALCAFLAPHEPKTCGDSCAKSRLDIIPMENEYAPQNRKKVTTRCLLFSLENTSLANFPYIYFEYILLP